MGGAQQPVGSTDRQVLDKGFADQLKGNAATQAGQTADYSQKANTAAGNLQTNFQQYAPSLNTNFQQHNPNLQTNFTPTGHLDAQSQGLLSAADQQRTSQLTTQNNQISSQFGANNPGLAGILQQQAAARSKLSANPMLFQVGSDQVQREQQQGVLANQARLQASQQGAALQQQGNQAQLQKTETNANLAGAGNAALGQQLNMYGQPIAASQNMTSVLANLAQLYGYQQATPVNPGSTTINTNPMGGSNGMPGYSTTTIAPSTAPNGYTNY